MHRSLQYVGLSLVIIGAILLIVPTASFSTIAGDRSVDVSIADDSEAFVAVAETESAVTQPGDGAAVAELVNNIGEPMTVEYEASVAADAVAVEQSAGTVTIGRGETAPISAACSPPGSGSGTATLRIDVVEATAGTTTVEDATLETTFEYDCPARGGGGPSGPPGDAVAYVDDNRNGEYDEGERVVAEDELPEFDDDGAHLVIAADGARLDFRNREVDLEARSVTVGDTTLASNRAITLAAEEAIELRESTIDAKNGAIDLEAGTTTATDSTLSSNRGISVSAGSGPLTLSDTTVDSKNGEIELIGSSVVAPRATVSSNRAIELAADSGPLTVSEATVDSTNGEVDLAGRSIAADGADISTNTEITVAAESGALDLTDASVESTNGEIDLSGGSIDADGAEISTNAGISIATDAGDLGLTEAAVESTNGEIEIDSADRLLAAGAVFETNAGIALSASGDVTLDNGRVTSTNGAATADLGVASATLAVDGTVIEDVDATLTYSPEGATVTGTPAQGTIAAG